MELTFQIILAAAFGAIFGSYATLFAYRLPLDESCFGRYFGPKSRCPSCNKTIRTRELIPLINWFFTLGKCTSCGVKIPRTHLFLELFTTIFFVFCFLKFEFTEDFILYSLVCVSLLILLVTDYTHKKFPNHLLFFITTLGLIARVIDQPTIINLIYSAAIGVVFATIFYQIFYKKTNGFFTSKNQSLEYAKLILVAAIFFEAKLFLLYFIAVMLIFTSLLILDKTSKTKHFNYGYCLIVPFLWLIFLPPSF